MDHLIRRADVSFSVDAEMDEMPVRGNALASGDDAADRECEDEILARLESGDVWAWACVKVTASITLDDGRTFEASEFLGGCCYASEADFKVPGGYYEDLCTEAFDALDEKVREATYGPRRKVGKMRVYHGAKVFVARVQAGHFSPTGDLGKLARELSIGLAEMEDRPTLDRVPDCGCYPDGTGPCTAWPECGGPPEV
jgi:hypothetical protein